MSILFYKSLHLISLMVLVMSLGAILSHMLQGGKKENFKNRKSMAILHGTSALFAFVSGFGLMAKTGFSFSNSPWIFVKIAGWLFVGLLPTLSYKRILPPWIALFSLIAVIAITILTVLHKPF